MGLYDDIKSTKSTSTSKKGGGLYDDIVSSTNSKTSQPKESFSSKVGGVTKDLGSALVKPFQRTATNALQTAQALTKLPEILRTGKSTFTPVQPFGKDIKPVATNIADKGFSAKNLGKDALDIGGTSLEFASYAPIFGGAVKAMKTATLAKGLAKEGAIGGFTGTLGQQMQEKAVNNTPFSLSNLMKGTAGGAVLAPVLGVAGRQFGKMTGRGARAVDKVEVAPVLSQEQKYQNYLANQGYTPYTNPNELPTIQVGAKTKLPNELPTIQMNGSNQPNVFPPSEGMRYEPIANQSISSELPDAVSSIMDKGKRTSTVT